MTEPRTTEPVPGVAAMLRFLRGRILHVLSLPALFLVMTAGLWAWTITDVDADRRAAEKQAMTDASDLCNDYAALLSQLIDQVNQITLQIRFNWEQSSGQLNLLEYSQSGIFHYQNIANIEIIDRDGKFVTGTSVEFRDISLAQQRFFQFHKNDPSDILLIGQAAPVKSGGEALIPLSRRLNREGGAFQGAVVVFVDPSYLTSFYVRSYPGTSGLLATVGLDGNVRAAKIGPLSQQSAPPALKEVPLLGTALRAFRLDGDPWFGDGQARFVAWQSLRDYPLIAMVGLAEGDYMAPHRRQAATSEALAAGGTLVLLLFAVIGTARAVRTARARHEQQMVELAYRLATEGANEGFYMYESLREKAGGPIDFKLVDCNERAARFYGMKRDQIIGMKLSDLHPPPHFDQLLHMFRHASETGFHEEEVRFSGQSRLKIAWAKIRLVRSGKGLAVTMLDTSEEKRTAEKMTFMAHHDPLTGLPNRVLLDDRFEQSIAAAKRDKTHVGVMFFDLDHFKEINDSFGHQIGDRLLIEVVKKLYPCIRATDTICRLGGDEFIILLPNIRQTDDVGRVARSMLDALGEPIVIDMQQFHTSASIGIALYPEDGRDIGALLRSADTAMYKAKEAGRNVYQFFTAQMNIDAQAKLRMHNLLRNALQRGEFELHYQPQIDLGDEKVVGVEALIRWRHPELGMVPPGQFIPIAESSGLIIPIGDWVLQEACRQARIWHDGGRSFRVAVNLSALQFKRGNILETVRGTLKRSRLPPGMLELELTESILVQDMDTALHTLLQLKEMGVQLSIDDFGTGYSSLSYLKKLHVDKLKIDQTFVRDIVTDVEDLAIAQAIIQLGKTLQLKVIAEGVETVEQVQSLRANGCDEAQGYLISRPMTAADTTAWLAARLKAQILSGDQPAPPAIPQPAEPGYKGMKPDR
jgi:diguanylate cyclase (GGDEF)-like protein/PAS domain S-box-containing protein